MKKRILSLILVLTMIFTSSGVFALETKQPEYVAQGNTAEFYAASEKINVIEKIFGKSDISDDGSYDDKAPYRDGTFLSDVREPMAADPSGAKVYGDDSRISGSSVWTAAKNPILLSNSGKITVHGTTFSHDTTAFKALAAHEGDFDGDGRKNEIAVIAAIKGNDGASRMLLCVTAADTGDYLVPIAVLYNSYGSKADFYKDTDKFVNCIAIVCADINGDGYDEIVTATPTRGFGENSGDEYGFDKSADSRVWYLNSDGRTGESWKTSDGWCETPHNLNVGMQMWVSDCHLGTPGTTASLAAGDINGDGYDDIISAVSTTNAQYTNYSGNMFSVYYIGGAEQFSDMILNRDSLMRYISGNVADSLSLGITSGDASGFDVTVSDVDDSGKPTIFLSFKETNHRYAKYSGDKMFTPRYYIYSFDYNEKKQNFTASLVHSGGILHHGWVDSTDGSDTEYVYKLNHSDCAPVRIGVLREDFGITGGKNGYVSSGTIVADQKYVSFVRYPDGNRYRYETRDSGSFSGTWGTDADTGWGFKSSECVFPNNGINITDIRTANVSFDGKKYTDAALITAYSSDGYRTYFVMGENGCYSTHPGSTLSSKAKKYTVAAMPDVDSDSIYLKYNKHVFFWSDPVIVAALASAPYFGSLPSDMYTNSTTTYGKSISSATGNTKSFTVSAGSYVSTEIKAGAGGASGVFETETEALVSSSSENENTNEVTFTQSFSASGGEDTVVLTTVGYDAYAYTAYYPGETGKTVTSPYIVYVPRNGADAIKTASLNYEDYLAFTEYSSDALPYLHDVFTHTVGKPETYPDREPSGSHVLNGSVISHPKLSTFPSNTGSQTLTTEITEETTETTSTGSSISVKLGGGIESEADDIFGLANAGAKITVGGISEKEYESGRIRTTAVGTSFEGTVFGQGDGMNVSGSGQEKADFNWRLLHYIYTYGEGNDIKQFPVITYITSGVTQPEGVVPESVSVTPSSRKVEQVGPKTSGFVNTAKFSVSSPGVTRESHTGLVGAPIGMSLDTGGTNIASAGPMSFGVNINGNIKPGKYDLQLNIGGVLSNVFTVEVAEYTEPVWIEADKTEIDFGSMRYNYAKGTPSAESRTVTVKSIYTQQQDNFTAYMMLGDDSPFKITEPLSSDVLYQTGLDGSSATVSVSPVTGLDVGTYTDTLVITNEITAAFVTLKFTVTNPTLPQRPDLSNNFRMLPNPISVNVSAPDDDGGGIMQYYLYTVKDHADYVKDGEQVWERYSSTAQSGSNFNISPDGEFEIGQKYTIGVKAVTDVGESDAEWYEFEVRQSEGKPDPVKNVKVYPGNGSIALTWDEPDYWGENEYYPEINGKQYSIYFYTTATTATVETVNYDGDLQWSKSGLENDKEYRIEIYTRNKNPTMYGCVSVNAAPSADIKAAPTRPSSFGAYMSYKTAKLSWKAPVYDGNSAITGYMISKDGGKTWTDVGNVTEYTFENLVTNTEYQFAVRAVNSVGNGDISYYTAAAPSKLYAATVNKVVIGYEQLELDWQPYDEEDGVLGYQVQISDGGDWIDIEPVVFDGTLHYVFTGLENGVMYQPKVRAYDSEGPGPYGNHWVMKNVSPSENAPRAVVNASVKPRNGGIQLYGESFDGSDSLQYKLDGDRWWYGFENGELVFDDRLENGKEYVVAVSSGDYYDSGKEYRSTSYFTVKPESTIPNPPSGLNVSAYVGDGYIRAEWTLESDGGSPITEYKIKLGEGADAVSLPASYSSFEIPCAEQEREMYGIIYVYAENAEGETSDYVYLESGAKISGQSRIVLPYPHIAFISSPYKFSRTYTFRDENDNEVEKSYDMSEHADWSFESDNSAVTWNADNRTVEISDGLAKGEYSATVRASGGACIYEMRIAIVVGASAELVSVQKSKNGVSVELALGAELGENRLYAASYDKNGRLLNVASTTVSAELIQNGKISVPIDLNGAHTVRVMLFSGLDTYKPLCGSILQTVG